jgi:hypothetical protein
MNDEYKLMRMCDDSLDWTLLITALVVVPCGTSKPAVKRVVLGVVWYLFDWDNLIRRVAVFIF